MIVKLIKKSIKIHEILFDEIIDHPYIKINKIKLGKKYFLYYLYESFYYYISMLEGIKHINIEDITMVTSIIFYSIYEIFNNMSKELEVKNFFWWFWFI